MTKEKGIKKVVDNNPTDYQKILAFARNWVSERMRPFTADDLRNDYEAVNIPPVQPKIYGGVFNTLYSQKLIKQNGTAISKRPQAHSRLIRTWISLTYSEQQANNRRNNLQIQMNL